MLHILNTLVYISMKGKKKNVTDVCVAYSWQSLE